MKLVMRLATPLALAFTVCAPARADDTSKVVALLTTAAAQVTSFVMEFSMPGTTGVTGSATFVSPMTVMSSIHVGNLRVESYIIDGVVYLHSPNGWQKMTLTAAQAAANSFNIAAGLKAAKVTLLPDREEGGMTLGVVAVDAQLPSGLAGSVRAQPAQHIVCTYEKETNRMQTCASGFMTMRYVKYNDPANVVTLPPEAKNAVPIVLPSPATAPVPVDSPAATAPDSSPTPAVPAPAVPPAPVNTPSPG